MAARCADRKIMPDVCLFVRFEIDYADHRLRPRGFPRMLATSAQTHLLERWQTRSTHRSTHRPVANTIWRRDGQEFTAVDLIADAHRCSSRTSSTCSIIRHLPSRVVPAWPVTNTESIETAHWHAGLSLMASSGRLRPNTAQALVADFRPGRQDSPCRFRQAATWASEFMWFYVNS